MQYFLITPASILSKNIFITPASIYAVLFSFIQLACKKFQLKSKINSGELTD